METVVKTWYKMSLTFHQAIFLFLAWALGGALNVAVGGGSFVTFPALLFTGVPPIPANATNTFAVGIGMTAFFCESLLKDSQYP